MAPVGFGGPRGFGPPIPPHIGGQGPWYQERWVPQITSQGVGLVKVPVGGFTPPIRGVKGVYVAQPPLHQRGFAPQSSKAFGAFEAHFPRAFGAQFVRGFGPQFEGSPGAYGAPGGNVERASGALCQRGFGPLDRGPVGADTDQASSSNALPDCQLNPLTNPSISMSENPSISISISEIACESKIQDQSNPGRQPRLVLTPLGKVRPSPLTACLGIDQVRGLQPFPPRDLKEKTLVKSAGVSEAAPREVDPPSAEPVEGIFPRIPVANFGESSTSTSAILLRNMSRNVQNSTSLNYIIKPVKKHGAVDDPFGRVTTPEHPPRVQGEILGNLLGASVAPPLDGVHVRNFSHVSPPSSSAKILSDLANLAQFNGISTSIQGQPPVGENSVGQKKISTP